MGHNHACILRPWVFRFFRKITLFESTSPGKLGERGGRREREIMNNCINLEDKICREREKEGELYIDIYNKQ